MAQLPTGVPLFGSFSGGPETINNADLNIHWQIPIRQKAGLVPFYYILTYDNAIWYPAGTSGNQYWWTSPGSGWQTLTPLVMGSLTFNQTQGSCHDLLGNTYYFNLYSDFVFTDPGGAVHAAPSSLVISDKTIIDTSCKGGGSGGSTAAQTLIKDNYGYTIYAQIDSDDFNGTDYYPKATVYAPSGAVFIPTITSYAPNPHTPNLTDNNGNSISVSTSNGTTTFTDTLGTPALAYTLTSQTETTFTYTGGAGTATATVNYTQTYVQTNFGCTGIRDYGPVLWNLVTGITLADGSTYSFSYETTPGDNHNPHYVTGRLASVTLPTGGTITYTYSGGSGGITCADGVPATLERSTPDTQSNYWEYQHAEGSSGWTTALTDPAGNVTNYSFQQASGSENLYETQRVINQGPSTVLETVNTCYNGASIPCTGTSVSLPITQKTGQKTMGGMTKEHITDYDSTGYGLPVEYDEYDWGTSLLRKTITAYDYNNSCGVTNSFVVDKPCSVTIENSTGGSVASTSYSYDANGNMLSASSDGLTTSYTYNSNGTVASSTDVNNAQTSYSYTGAGGCNSAFPTSAYRPLSLSTAAQWDCTGGVVTQATDANGNSTNYGYADPLWRVTSVEDPTTATTYVSYTTASNGSPATIQTSLSFNGGASAVDTLTCLDGLGRAYITQQAQTPNGSTYDSAKNEYDSNGRWAGVSAPYSGSACNSGASSWNTTQYDPLNRPTSSTDAGGGTLSYAYSKNDVMVTVGPAPSGENTKSRQLEYDGLGRLTSVCEITSMSGSGSCSQNASANGYFTSYSYDPLNDLTAVSQSGQSRSYSYDSLGRLTGESNPESGTTAYTYDTDGTCGTSHGDAVKKVDAVGNTTCIQYDALHRPTTVTYPSGSYASVTAAKYFVYDSATVNGSAMANAKGRLAEAYTVLNSATQTDLGFSYSPRGEINNALEATPNSGGYYNVSESYWANGAPSSLSGTALPSLSYGVDGEGRVATISDSLGGQPVTSTTYSSGYGLPTNVSLGSGDSDAFGYDIMGRMNSYAYNVGSQSITGNLTWNANGTLGQLAITDPFNSSNQQTCNYAHDDLMRISSANCGSIWDQTFSYDAFGNISKTGVSGAESFQPTYNSSTNQYSSVPLGTPSYDADGNAMADGFHTYTWGADGNPLTITDSGTGYVATNTYDALGRKVEESHTEYSLLYQLAYGPTGKVAVMSGQTLYLAKLPLPGGGIVAYTPGTPGPTILRWYHPDWQGSIRFDSLPDHTWKNDEAYAPFGEQYADTGISTIFTGQWPMIQLDYEDFLFREYHFVQGRWVSPDPAGLKAVNPANPQTWNRYAYVTNNPLAMVDPQGLNPACLSARPHRLSAVTSPCGGDYGGGGLSIDGGGDISPTLFGGGTPWDPGLGGGESTVQCPGNVCEEEQTNQYGITQIVQFWAFTGSAEVADGYYPGLDPVNLQAVAIQASLSGEQFVNANPGQEIGGEIYDIGDTGVYGTTITAGYFGVDPSVAVGLVPADDYIEGAWHSQFGAIFNDPYDNGYPDQPAWVGTPAGSVFMNTGPGTTCVLTGPRTGVYAGNTYSYPGCN